MNASAWVMFFIGAVGLWGGFAYFLWIAYKTNKEKV
ncbi:MAG: MetS family NSS transporter small subunit [Firmicutes bacterium]|nr:MetS family NSS transporter small subunit [Melghirimyces thermohalophilus]MDA8353083.1 MetS family NSS transporter small subunit [Bacillota bacterium]